MRDVGYRLCNEMMGAMTMKICLFSIVCHLDAFCQRGIPGAFMRNVEPNPGFRHHSASVSQRYVNPAAAGPA